MPLDGPRLPPKSAPPQQLIVLLHGIGADGADVLPLGASYQTVLPAAAVVAPNAPLPFDLAPAGRMWFSIRDLQPTTRRDGVRAAAPLVNAFIDDELARLGISASALVLAGFSQGAMVALHVGLRRSPPPAAIVSHSGLVADNSGMAAGPDGVPPVLLTHGAADEVLPPTCLSLSRLALQAAGVPVEAHLVAGLGHGIDPPTVALARRFLAGVLSAQAT